MSGASGGADRASTIRQAVIRALAVTPVLGRAALVTELAGRHTSPDADPLQRRLQILAIVREMQEAGELLLWHAMRAGRVSALVGLPDATLTQAMPPQACCGPVAGSGEASEPAAVPQAGVPLLTQEVVKAALLLRQWADNHNLTGRWHIAGIGGVEVR